MQKISILAFSLGLACTAGADTIYATSFEAPTITVGSINGQDGWYEGYSSAANVVTGFATTGTQSLQIKGSDLTLDPTSNTYLDFVTTSAYMSPSAYSSTSVSVNARLDGPLSTPNAPGGDLMSVNLDLHDDVADIAQMWLSSNGNVYTIANGVAYNFAAGVTPGVYHNLAMSLDIVNETVTFSVDGSAIGTEAVDPSLATSAFLYSDLQMDSVNDFPGYDHTQYTGHFDDFNWTAQAVPEPGVIVVGLGVAIGFLLKKRS